MSTLGDNVKQGTKIVQEQGGKGGSMPLPEDCVSYHCITHLNPDKAIKDLFENHAGSTFFHRLTNIFSMSSKLDLNNEHDLDRIAESGRFPYRPSDLFLKMYASAQLSIADKPLNGVVSPSLLSTSGVVPFTCISVITDIMQHYHDVIVDAKHEVLIATNAWESGKSVELVTTAFEKLNDLAGKEKRRVVVKILMDVASVKNVLGPRFNRSPDSWPAIGLPSPEKVANLEMEVVNYHCAPLGTFHTKLMIVDRTVALINSNNVNIRSNVEMMCRVEGDVVNSIYDTFLISWRREFANPPGLPCIKTPAVANRKFDFGEENVTIHPDKSSSNLVQELADDRGTYIKQDHPQDVKTINERLNINKEADATVGADDEFSDFTPFVFHSRHDPVPMAVVNRPPYAMPGHQDVQTPQNAAWLAGLHYAKTEVFIQSPVFNANPVVDAVVEACKRGITVTLFIGLGFNDLAESVPFQGGTNEQVMQRMFKELEACGKDDNLRYHWYTAKDQNAPIRFDTGQRNCHVKFMQVDRQVGIMGKQWVFLVVSSKADEIVLGSGNMDTQVSCYTKISH